MCEEVWHCCLCSHPVASEMPAVLYLYGKTVRVLFVPLSQVLLHGLRCSYVPVQLVWVFGVVSGTMGYPELLVPSSILWCEGPDQLRWLQGAAWEIRSTAAPTSLFGLYYSNLFLTFADLCDDEQPCLWLARYPSCRAVIPAPSSPLLAGTASALAVLRCMCHIESLGCFSWHLV